MVPQEIRLVRHLFFDPCSINVVLYLYHFTLQGMKKELVKRIVNLTIIFFQFISFTLRWN